MSGAAASGSSESDSKTSHLSESLYQRLKDDVRAVGFLLAKGDGRVPEESAHTRWLLTPVKVWQLHLYLEKHKARFRPRKKKQAWSQAAAMTEGVASGNIGYKTVAAAQKAWRREMMLQEQPQKRKLKSCLPERLELALAELVRSRARENMPMTDDQVLHFATCLRRTYLPKRLRKGRRPNKEWVNDYMKRRELHSLTPEDKSIDRSAAESAHVLINWFIAFASILGMSIDKSTGKAIGELKKYHPSMIANADETVVLVESPPGQNKFRDLKVVVDSSDDRATLRRSRFAKTNVAYIPFVTVDGLVADVVIFKYDGKGTHDEGFRLENDRLKQMLKDLPKEPTDEQVQKVLDCQAVAQRVAYPSPTQLLFVTDVPEEFKEVVTTKRTSLVATPTGYSNATTFGGGVRLLADHFDTVRTKEKLGKDARGLLIVDGHTTHHTAALKALCAQRNIDLVFLPPNTTHFMQPLDVACMASFKRVFAADKPYFGEFIASRYRIEEQKAKTISTKEHLKAAGLAKNYGEEYILPMLMSASRQAFTAKNATSGFRKCGLLPLDPVSVMKGLKMKDEVIKAALAGLVEEGGEGAASGAGADDLEPGGAIALVCIMLGIDKPPPLWRDAPAHATCTLEQVTDALVKYGERLNADQARDMLVDRRPGMAGTVDMIALHIAKVRESGDRAELAEKGTRKPRTKTQLSRRLAGVGGTAEEARAATLEAASNKRKRAEEGGAGGRKKRPKSPKKKRRVEKGKKGQERAGGGGERAKAEAMPSAAPGGRTRSRKNVKKPSRYN